MLRRVDLSNFKCFERLELRCAAINLLCGLNGMGKSSLLQALLVLRQSVETGELHKGRLVLGGERADLGTGMNVLFDGAQDDTLGFGLHSDETQPPWEVRFAYSQTADQLSAVGDELAHDFVPGAWREIPPLGGHLIYVNAERIGPRKLYPISYVRSLQADFGPSSEYAWSYLNSHQDDFLDADDPRCVHSRRAQMRDLVDLWLQEVSPGVHLNLEPVTTADSVIAEFRFDRPGDVASGPYRATNVGFGLSYTLPVILALLAPPGAMCLIENPESHLHPRGQTKLAELAVRAALAGVQVFVETHSDHFMDGVRIAVREGLIEPENAAFHYFERDGDRSVVTSPEVDRDGRLSQWPVGFFDQHTENMMKLMGSR